MKTEQQQRNLVAFRISYIGVVAYMLFLVLFLMMAACGIPDPNGESKNTVEVENGATEDTTADTETAQLAVSKDDLWQCNEALYRQIVYIEEEREFYYCSPKTQKWQVIIMKHPEGMDGKDGYDGRDGVNGKDGKQGPKGDKGDPAPVQP